MKWHENNSVGQFRGADEIHENLMSHRGKGYYVSYKIIDHAIALVVSCSLSP